MSTATLSPEVLEMLAIGSLPDQEWAVGDDLCDCVYQRIAQFTNPYLAETTEIRLCCMWAELTKMFPQFARHLGAYYDHNAKEWDTQPKEWDADFDMPKALWYRQISRMTGQDIADVRAEYADKDYLRPRGKTKVPFYLAVNGMEYLIHLG